MSVKARSGWSSTEAPGTSPTGAAPYWTVVNAVPMPLTVSRFAAFSVLLALTALPTVQAERASARQEAPVAAFDGLWCGTGLLHEFSLHLSQQQQDVQGTLVRRERRRELEGHVEGGTLHTQATRHGSLVLQRSGDELRVTGGDGALALARGATFQRANGAACAG